MKCSEAFASTDSKESRFAPDPLRFLIARIRSFVRREGTVVLVIRDRANLRILVADASMTREYFF